MKTTTLIVTATTTLALAGGLFAAQANATPTTPTPTPSPASPTAVAPGGTAGQAKGQGVGWFFSVLTDVQRSCLADAGVHRPAGKLTSDQVKQLRAAIDAALATCEVRVPERLAGRDRLGFRWAALNAEQQQCLADIRLTRPVGRLTAEQRAAVRQSKLAAVKACGA